MSELNLKHHLLNRALKIAHFGGHTLNVQYSPESSYYPCAGIDISEHYPDNEDVLNDDCQKLVDMFAERGRCPVQIKKLSGTIRRFEGETGHSPMSIAEAAQYLPVLVEVKSND